MIIAYVESGVCRFHTEIRAVKSHNKIVRITLESDCEQITALGKELKELGLKDILKTPVTKNPVYEKAGECHLHPACPVPCGIIKSAEIEMGLALLRNVSIEFQKENQ
jgi:hypothetical protein